MSWLRAAESYLHYRNTLSYVKKLPRDSLARNKLVEECNGNEQKLVDLGKRLLGGVNSDAHAAIQREGQVLVTCSHCGVSAQSSAHPETRDTYRHPCFYLKYIRLNNCPM